VVATRREEGRKNYVHTRTRRTFTIKEKTKRRGRGRFPAGEGGNVKRVCLLNKGKEEDGRGDVARSRTSEGGDLLYDRGPMRVSLAQRRGGGGDNQLVL